MSIKTKGDFLKTGYQAIGEYFIIRSQDVPGDNNVYSEIYNLNIKDTSPKES